MVRDRAHGLWIHAMLLAGMVATLAVPVPARAEKPLLVLAGAASKPAMERIVADWRASDSRPVEVAYGGSGQLLAQLKLTRRGDIYFPASPDFLDKAHAEGLIVERTTTVYLVPALCVKRGNPHAIRTLRDLLRPGLRVALAHPETVAAGRFAAEILQRTLSPEERAALRGNLVNYATNVEALAVSLALGPVDAIIGWSVLEHWDPERIEAVRLAPADYPRFGRMDAATTTRATDPATALDFLRHLRSARALDAFRAGGYFVDLAEARAFAGAEKSAAGEPDPPDSEWLAPR